jgi:hypothetical protein
MSPGATDLAAARRHHWISAAAATTALRSDLKDAPTPTTTLTVRVRHLLAPGAGPAQHGLRWRRHQRTAVVRLSRPLGGRVLVDSTDGGVIPVANKPIFR